MSTALELHRLSCISSTIYPRIAPVEYLDAARVPHALQPQEFGLWSIERRRIWAPGVEDDPSALAILRRHSRWPDITILRRVTLASLHQPGGEVVMEDSRGELSRHLPIWMAARGRVLKTGLGLGCVVRGLLLNPRVEHVDVVEIDAEIIRVVGAEFVGNPRVTIHFADALTWDFGERRWDYAWHDLHSFDDRALQLMHAELIARYLPAVDVERQGAWAFPRETARCLPKRLLGAPKVRRCA